jgi:hypothetical protein
MTLTQTSSGNSPLNNSPIYQVESGAPYVFVLYNGTTKTVVGKVQYRASGITKSLGCILACDTYANLQGAAASAGLTGTLSPDPTPNNSTPGAGTTGPASLGSL